MAARAGVDAVDAGLRLLGRRPHSHAELRNKLRRRGYPAADIAAALARLASLGYLDDSAFAAGHVRRRAAGRGPLALSRELAARGVDRGVAELALAGYDRDAQVAFATRLAERLYAKTGQIGYARALDVIGPKLLRRGFAASVVRAACRAASSGTAGDPEA